MTGANFILPTDALARWHDFYILLGTASATMVGLLFVAVSVASGVFGANRRAALRVFLSASVVNFCSILGACLTVLAPIKNWAELGVVIVSGGLIGLAHTCMGYRDTVRDGLFAKIDLEDRIWYLVMPFLGYVAEAASGITLILRWDQGCAALALAMGLLLVAGIHNAWDITLWSATRRQD